MTADYDVVHIRTEAGCVISVNGQGHLPCSLPEHQPPGMTADNHHGVKPDCWADDDAVELARRRQASEDMTARAEGRARPRAPHVVPVRADSPGRDFDLEQVGPGWVLYSAASFDGPLDAFGVCVEVVVDRRIDDETGEVTVGTVYRCLPFGSTRQVFLPAADVDTAQLPGVNRLAASDAARRLVTPLVLSRSAAQRRRTFNRDEAELFHDAWRLAAAAAL
jgi:hypothetical protein